MSSDGGGSTGHSFLPPPGSPPVPEPGSGPPLRCVVFDTETSGLDLNSRLHLLALWDSKPDWVSVYTNGEIPDAIRVLEAADVIVSWNGKRYDQAILRSNGGIYRAKYHLDLWEFITDTRPKYEKGWSLGAVSQRLFKIGKPTESATMDELWQQGRHLEVAKHCLWDVYLTRSILEFVREHQYLPDPNNRPHPIPIPPWFDRLPLKPGSAPGVNVVCL